MASRRARRARAQHAAAQRTDAAHRVDTARTEIAHRSLLAAADQHTDLPLFRAVALDLGVVPDPAPVPAATWTDRTRLVPVVGPRLLGLMATLLDEENGAAA
jgi:hypothetical protein